MIVKIILALIAIFFPFVALFIKDEPGKAMVALALQGTIIGWPFAIVWAWKIVFKRSGEPQTKKGKGNPKMKTEAKA